MLEHRTSEEEEILSHSYIIIMVCNMYMTEYVYIYIQSHHYIVFMDQNKVANSYI